MFAGEPPRSGSLRALQYEDRNGMSLGDFPAPAAHGTQLSAAREGADATMSYLNVSRSRKGGTARTREYRLNRYGASTTRY